MRIILRCMVAVLMINCGQYKTQAQVLPKDGDTLNYRLVGFSFPEHKKATAYQLELYTGNDVEPPDADMGITSYESPGLIFSKQYTDSQVIETVPAFNQSYKWRVLYKKKKNTIDSTGYYHFRTGYSETTDSSKYRLKILKNNLDNDGQLFVLDFISVIYDADGQPLWYLPDIPVVADKNIQMRDLKPTKDGTFTAVSGLGAYEFDYNGKVLWQAPNDGQVSGDTTEHYHHEFTKLSNNHYMVCGHERIIRKIPTLDFINLDTLIKNGVAIKGSNNEYSMQINAGTLIEYDAQGKVVWYWKSSEQCSDSDFFRKSPRQSGLNTDMHLNAFWFDESNKFIYMSYRNTNEIMKIAYPSGTIVARYNGESPDGEDLYFGQHSIRKAPDGRLYLFNNNSKMVDFSNGLKNKRPPTSYITVLEEITGSNPHVKKLWEYSCDIDTYALAGAGAGGSVEMLPDQSILASMGAASRIFIVSQDKRLLFNAVPQAADGNGNWFSLGQYRTSTLRKEELKKFIFNIQQGK